MNDISHNRVVEALARERFLPFLMLVFELLHPGKPALRPSWYIRAIAWWLERVEAGFLLRSMIWLQPRALKSVAVAVAFPCWLVGRDPTREVLVVTYSDKLGLTHAQHRKRVLESPMYQRLFPEVRVGKDGNRILDILLTRGGRIRAISVEGTVTGYGGHFIILDDCMKPEDTQSDTLRQKIKDWYEQTISTRTIDERSSIISIQQRLHEDDLPAFLLEKGYRLLCLPARASADMDIDIGPGLTHHWKRNELLCPELMSETELERKRYEHGPQAFAAQFLQDPIAPAGNLIRIDHFRRFEEDIPRYRFDKVFQSWDMASSTLPTADWSVCTTWGYLAGRIFLLDIIRERLEYWQLKTTVIAMRRKWHADDVIIEDCGPGQNLAQELRRNGPFNPISMRPTTDKAERLIAQSGQIEEGRVWLPAELPGLDLFVAELKAFPFGRHDDQVDTLTQVLEFIMYNWKYADTEHTPSGRPIRIIRQNDRPGLPPLPEWIV